MRSDFLRGPFALYVVAIACGGRSDVPTPPQGREPSVSVKALDAPPKASATQDPAQAPLPEHMRTFPGLFVRVDGRVVEAPETDIAAARGYPTSPDKGTWVAQRRISILSARQRVRAGEPVRVIHVTETVRPGDELFVMGPKKVAGEYVDGTLRTQPAPAKQDPLRPWIVDGRSLPAPAVDYNWEITEYRFSAPGPHTIEWRLGALVSNALHVEVVK